MAASASLSDRVTLRQLCAATASALLLPLTTLLSRCDWPWVGAGAALACGYYIMYRRRPAAETENRTPKPLAWLHAAALLLLCALLSQQVGTLFPETAGRAWVGLGVLLLAAAAASRGTAVVLRCGAVLCLPLTLVCGAVVLLAIPGAKASWLAPQNATLGGAASLLLFLIPASFFCLAPRSSDSGDGCTASPWKWALALGVFATLCAAVTSACLSPRVAAQPMSFYTLARSVSVFGVMLRLESFVSGALTASAFAGMGLLLRAAKKVLQVRAPDGSVWALVALAGLLSLLPGKILSLSAAVSAIFCAGIPIVTQALVDRKKPEKKSVFFEKNC